MDNMIVKVTKIFTILIMVAGAVFTALVIWNAGDLKGNPALTATLLNPYFGIAAALLGLGIIITLLFAIVQMVSDKKSAVRVLISLALLGGIYLVSYFAASGNIDAPVYTKFDISSDESKLIGSLIILVYILGSAAILSILGSAVYKLTLKK
jgi:drug/metabolite transporter superfamily protein YnfA